MLKGIIGLLLVFFIPGLCISLHVNKLTLSDRLLLSFGLSVVIVPMIYIFFHQLGLNFTLYSYIGIVLLISLISIVLYLLLNKRHAD
jgi:uncharacterized membrane protein